MIETNVIHLGDCVQGLKTLPDECIDLVVSDVAYPVTQRGNAGNSGGMMQKELNKKGKVFEFNNINIEDYLHELYRVLKDGTHCYLMCNHVNLTHFLKVIDESKFHFIKCLIWQKCLAGKTELLLRNKYTGVTFVDTMNELFYRMQLNTSPDTYQIMGDDGKFKGIKSITKIGKRKTLSIKFRNGDVISCTPEHPFVTPRGLTMAKDLTVGSIVSRCERFENITNGSTMTYDDGWLVGFYLAEGNYSNKDYALQLAVNRKDSESEIGEKITRIAKRYNASIHIHKHKDKYCDTWRLNGILIVSLIKEFLGGRKALTKEIKSLVFSQPIDFIQGLFDGYMAGDGHKEKTGENTFRYCLSICDNPILLRGLQVICGMLGMKFTYAKGFSTCNEKKFPIYRIHITEYSNHHNAKNLGEVISITETKMQNVYDIEVEGNHLYSLPGGFITHNCNKIMGTKYMNAFEYILFMSKGTNRNVNDCGIPDILSIPNIKTKDIGGGNIHDSEKPVRLMEILITQSSNEGDIVLDNFMGSGTTALACINKNRKYIGWEIDPKYHKLCEKRIKNHIVQTELF